MATDFFVITLLVASLAAFVFVWLKLRHVEQRLERGARELGELFRVVQSECMPALAESSRRLTTVLDRLEAERAQAQGDVAKAQAGLAPVLDELAKAAAHLGEVRVELARLVDRAASKPPAEEPARPADGAWIKDVVRTHLIGMGVGGVSIDGVTAKPDGSHVVRARGLRGSELWTGNVVVRGGKVESAAPVASRMFP
jgi:hypothetical protein